MQRTRLGADLWGMQSRKIGGAAALCLVVVLSAVPAAAQLPGTPLPPTVGATAVAEAPDWATDTFGDPWDYANDQDAHTWAPAVVGGTATLADGRLTLSLPGPGGGHVPLLFPSFEGTVLAERDGDRLPLDAGTYRTVVLRAHASRGVTAAVVSRTCTGVTQQCDSYGNVQLSEGWGTYMVQIPDAAPVHGLRLAVAAGPVDVSLDWVRVIAGTPSRVSIGAVGEAFWDADDSTSNNTADNPGWGRVDDRGFPARAHPPGAYRFYAALGDGSADDATRSALSDPLHVLARPSTIVVDPDVTGGEDYITAQTGDAWDFSQDSDGVVANATGVQIADGRLSATNTSNDPFVTLRMGPGLVDPNRYHRLTVSFTLDGPFDLSFDPGGGGMGRVLWSTQDPALLRWVDGNDIVAYPNQPTHTFLLGASTTLEEGGARPPWTTAPVTALRFDPNEDPGSRRWHLDDIRLTADDETSGGGFDITFDDPAFDVAAPAGTTTRYEVYADTDRTGHDGVLVASGPVTSRRTVARWDTGGVTPGRYEIHVRVVREGGGTQTAGDTYATGPLVVRAQDTTGGGSSGGGSGGSDAPAEDPNDVLRIAGPSRFATAAELALESFPDGASSAVVVTGQAFADALSAAPLAATLGGPVLLAARDALPTETADALDELGVRDVVVLGGAAAISEQVADRLGERGRQVSRISGPDRFATAAAVAEEMQRLGAVADEVVIASGSTFPDALAGGWRAAVQQTPLLLIGGNGLSPATAEVLAELDVSRVVIVGGTAAVSQAAAATVTALGVPVLRIAGDSRWSTAAQVVSTTPGVVPTGALVASGEDFPDALAAGPAAAATGRLLSLTARDALPAPTAELLVDAGRMPVRVVGGPAAVGAGTLAGLVALLGLPVS